MFVLHQCKLVNCCTCSSIALFKSTAERISLTWYRAESHAANAPTIDFHVFPSEPPNGVSMCALCNVQMEVMWRSE